MNPGASVLVPHTDMDEDAWDDLLSFIEERLNVDVSQLPHPYTLNDVVCWFLGARGRPSPRRTSGSSTRNPTGA